jgi:hypothetical protein
VAVQQQTANSNQQTANSKQQTANSNLQEGSLCRGDGVQKGLSGVDERRTEEQVL